LKLIERRSGPFWYAKTRVPGRTAEQTTRRLAPAHLAGGQPPNGHLTRKQAEDALADLLAVERRNVGAGAYDHLPSGATFADAAAGYLRHVEHVKGREVSTVRDYRYSIAKYLNPRWGERPVNAIRSADVEAFRDELMASKLSARTVVRHLTVAHGVFKFALRQRWLDVNPGSAEYVDRPTVSYSGEYRTYDREELAALVRAADGQDKVLFLAAAMTGLRQGELLALRWRDIDFANQRVHVRRAWSQAAKTEKTPKSGKVRSVPLVPDLIAPLDDLSRREHFTQDSDLVFCSIAGCPLDGWALRRRYGRAVKAAGLPMKKTKRGMAPVVTFHGLRHLFGSTAVRAFPLSDVQAMLGHAHITTTMRYVHHRPGADDAAKLSSAFRGESVSPFVSRTSEPQRNSAQLSDPESTVQSQAA
jgi:integrase